MMMSDAMMEEVRKLADSATPFALGDGNEVFLPITQAGGIPILPTPRFDVPMSEKDFEFYDISRSAIPTFIERISQLERERHEAVRVTRDWKDRAERLERERDEAVRERDTWKQHYEACDGVRSYLVSENSRLENDRDSLRAQLAVAVSALENIRDMEMGLVAMAPQRIRSAVECARQALSQLPESAKRVQALIEKAKVYCAGHKSAEDALNKLLELKAALAALEDK